MARLDDTVVRVRPRQAQTGDIEEVVRLAGLMFSDVGMDGTDPAWMHASRTVLYERLGRDVRAFVAEDPDHPDHLIAQVLGIVMERLPDPINRNGRSCYILWAVTEHAWRRCGISRCLLERLLATLEEEGIQEFELHASPDALSLYRELGFDAGPYPGLRRAEPLPAAPTALGRRTMDLS